MSGYYSLPSQGEWGKSKGTLSLNAGLRARLLNKKLTIGFSVGNILNNGSYSWNYQYPITLHRKDFQYGTPDPIL